VTSSSSTDDWIARPADKHGPEEGLEEHLQAVANLAARYASKFDLSGLGHNAGYLHDTGKALPHFQEYLRGNRDRDD
jgi:CRISPR/Cas system-associated endonuclease Cas3-HD